MPILEKKFKLLSPPPAGSDDKDKTVTQSLLPVTPGREKKDILSTSTLTLQENWAPQPDDPLHRLRDLFRAAGYPVISRLEPNRLEGLLFTPNSERTVLIEDMMKKIQPSNQFWIEDIDTGLLHTTEAQTDKLAIKFFTISEWYGLTSKFEVIQGVGTRAQQINFWTNLVKITKRLSQPVVQPKARTEKVNLAFRRIINSTFIQENVASADADPREASESLQAVKTITDLFKQGWEKAEQDILAITEKGVPSATQIVDTNLPGTGKLFNINMKRIHEGLVKKGQVKTVPTTSPKPRSNLYEIAEWESARMSASNMFKVGEAAKFLTDRKCKTKEIDGTNT